jgi:hypothetical protein
VNEHPLFEFDISWNCLDPKSVHEFFEELSSIKRFQDEMHTLNISNINANDFNVGDLNGFFHNKKFPNTHVIFYPNKFTSDVVDELCLLEYLNMEAVDFEPSFYHVVDFGLTSKCNDYIPTGLCIRNKWLANEPPRDTLISGDIKKNTYVNEKGKYPYMFELSESEWENSKVPGHLALKKEWEKMHKEKEKKLLKKLKAKEGALKTKKKQKK